MRPEIKVLDDTIEDADFKERLRSLFITVVVIMSIVVIVAISVATIIANKSLSAKDGSALLIGVSLAIPAIVGIVASLFFLYPRRFARSAADRPAGAKLTLDYAEELSFATAGLAADNDASRVGSIYALATISRTSRPMQTATSETLLQFIRSKTKIAASHTAIISNAKQSVTRDVQVALSVLGTLNQKARLTRGIPLRLDLSGLDLRKAQLSGLNLQGANFRGTWLDHADLTDAQFDGTDLSQASLVRAVAIDTSFVGAIIEKTDLSGAVLYGADFSRALMSGAKLIGAAALHADFRRAVLAATDFSGADLSGSDLRDSFLEEAKFDGANISSADLRSSRSHGLDLGPDSGLTVIVDDSTKLPSDP